MMFGELLEKFEDVLKSLSPEDLKKRIEGFDINDVSDAIDEELEGLDLEKLAYLHDLVSNEDAYSVLYNILERYVETLKEENAVDDLRGFLLHLLEVKRT